MKSWYTIKAASDASSANISIYEEIGGWGITAQQFSEDLKALGDIFHISLHIHSPGGDVFDGIAIYNLLNKNPAKVTVHIDGMDTPYLEQQEGFTVDGIAWKVRIDAGVAALDYRGLVKSSGA